jgi:Tol biopolymer transport system component
MATPHHPITLSRASALSAAILLALGATATAATTAAAAAPETIGGTIAFVSDRTGNDELYITDASGGSVQQLTDSPGFDRAPGWSPDGSSIVFNSRREPHPDRPQIYVLDVATGEQSRVTDSPLEEQRATWSPDGDSVFFHRGAFLAQPYNLVRHDLATGAESTLTDSIDPGVWNAAAAPRPGGEQVLFQSNRDAPASLFPQRLQLLDLATLAVTPVPGPASHPDGSIDGPRWNADGTAFTYSVSTDDGNQLFVTEASGSPETWEHVAVTDGLSADSAPAFSPDGSALVFQTSVEGATEAEDRTIIRVLDLDSGEITEIGEGRTPVWTATDWFGGGEPAPQLAATGGESPAWIVPAGLLAVAGGSVLLGASVGNRARKR